MPTTIDIAQIHEELQALRQQVALLQQQVQRPRVTLASSRPAPFLGQPVIITGTVTNAAGAPQAGAAVVLSTTWGRLKSRDRLLAEQGTSLVVVTGAEGQFSVDLLPPTSEDLLAAQQEALELFLAQLEPTAVTPRQTEADLREMAHLYQWDVNHAYRQALDIYFRDFGDGLLESVNVHDYLQQWDYLEATVVAYVQQPGGTTVEGLGALMVPFKHWLGPWLEVFLTLSKAQNPLPTVLDALQKTSPLGNLQAGVYRQVSDYVGSQSGIVGAYIGRKVVENTVQSFLLEGLDDLEVGVKADLAPSLQVASGLLAAGGVSGLQSVVQTRSELRLEVGTQIESSGIAVGALTDRVTGMATQLSGLQVNLGTVSGRVDTLQTGFNQFGNRLGGLATDVLGWGDRIEGLQGRFGQVDSTVSGLNEQFEGLRGQFNQFDRNVSGLSEQVGGLQGRFAQVDDQVGRLSSSMAGLTNQFGTLQGSFERLDTSTTTRFNQIGTRIGTLEGRVTVVDNRFGAVVGRVDTLDTTVTDFGNTLGVLDRTVADFGGSVGPLRDRLDTQDKTIATLQEQNQAFDGRLTTIQTSNQDMDGRVTQLNQEVVGLRQDTVSLNQGITQVNTSVDRLQRNVSTVNNQVNGLDTRVTTVQGGLTTLANRVSTLDTRVVTLDTRVGGITRDVTLLNTSVGTLQTSVSQVDTRLTTVGGQVGRLETNVSTLDGRFTNLNGQVGGIERNLSSLTRVSTDRIAVLENSISRVGNNVLSLRTDLNR